MHKVDIEPLIFHFVFVVYLEPSKYQNSLEIRKPQMHVYFSCSTAELYRITLTDLPVS